MVVINELGRLSVYVSIYLSVYVSSYLTVVYLSVYVNVHMCIVSIWLRIYLIISLSLTLSLSFSIPLSLSYVCVRTLTNLRVSLFLRHLTPSRRLIHSPTHALYESMCKCEYLFHALAPSLLLRLCLFLIALPTFFSFRYAHSVSYFPGLVFEFTAAVCAVSAMVVLFVRTQIIAGRGSQPYTAISGHCVKWAIGMKKSVLRLLHFLILKISR